MTSSNGTFSALLAFWAGNSPITGEFPPQRPVTRSFNVLFDLYLNDRLNRQSWGLWLETPSCSLWRHHSNWTRWMHGQCECMECSCNHKLGCWLSEMYLRRMCYHAAVSRRVTDMYIRSLRRGWYCGLCHFTTSNPHLRLFWRPCTLIIKMRNFDKIGGLCRLWQDT